MGRRRLLRVITRLNIGGPARQALLLTHALRPDYETTLLAGRPTGPEGELSDPRAPVRYIPLVRPPSPPNDVRAIAAVRHEIVRLRPHIVHTHMAKAGTVTRMAALATRRRPRLVHTFHGHVLEGYFSAATTRGIIEVERALARRTDRLVAVSEEVRDSLLALGIGTPEQYRVIRLGIDLDRHWETAASGSLRAMIGVDRETALVVAAGRLVPIKDLPTMIRAVGQLPGVHLALLGDGESRPQLERLVEELRLTDRVHFVGWVTDMPMALADADVVALSSRNEGTPVSLIEAAACGRCVVATDVGGVRSVVTDGVHGQLVSAGDVEGFAAALAATLSDPDEAQKMGAAARRDSRRFDHRRLVTDIASLYGEVLDG